MSQELKDGEFWLPPQFLDDDDLLDEFDDVVERNEGLKTQAGRFGNRVGSISGPGSDLGPSVFGSREVVREVEDYFTVLTRLATRSETQDDLWKMDSGFGYDYNTKPRFVSGSPQSTLSGMLASGRGSPNCHSPPQTAVANQNASAKDLVYAAAEEVARMKLAEENAVAAANYLNGRGLLPPPKHTLNDYQPKQSFTFEQLQAAAKLQQLRQRQQMLIRQHQLLVAQQIAQNQVRVSGISARSGGWPAQTQLPAMRTSVLPPKRESSGTGVFLPRQPGAPTETRKNHGCSTVSQPDNVVQFLNMKLEATVAQYPLQSRCTPSFTPDFESELRYQKCVLLAQQQRSLQQQALASSEFRLPQDWTY